MAEIHHVEIQEAATDDVLREQLDYLLCHASDQCPNCEDCMRLRAVRALLMMPFKEGVCRT
jgi:hypothetical protein